MLVNKYILCSDAKWDFGLIGIHAKPDQAVDEMRNLIDVYDDVIQKWSDVKVRSLVYSNQA